LKRAFPVSAAVAFHNEEVNAFALKKSLHNKERGLKLWWRRVCRSGVAPSRGCGL